MEKVITSELNKLIRRNIKLTRNDYLEYYSSAITSVQSFATGPHYWIIPDQQEVQILAASESISELTPYDRDSWEGKDLFFWFSIIHPDDRDFVSSSMAKFLQTQIHLGRKKGEKVFANIYFRMLNKAGVYRWVLMQFPQWMYNESDEIVSTLLLITDLSNCPQPDGKLLTIVDYSQGTSVYISRQTDNEPDPRPLVSLTAREMEVLQLMMQGLNTPKIAEQLCISYHTVENHKSNLRRKTGCKNSAQLVNFLWKNSIL